MKNKSGLASSVVVRGVGKSAPSWLDVAVRSTVAMLAIGVITSCGVVTHYSMVDGPRWEPSASENQILASSGSDDLSGLDDEFNDASSLHNWKLLSETEGWPDQIKKLDINTVTPGSLYLEPYTSFWFGDFHAPYLYKMITGDFVVTTRIQVTGAHDEVPQQSYSLGGILVRSPHDEGAKAWKEKTENWFFITAGSGDGDHIPQYETKDTVNGSSHLELTPRKVGWTELSVVRTGSHFVLLRNEGEGWKVLRRLDRPDLPTTLQVGLTAYTDYDTSKSYLIFNRVEAYHRDAAKIAQDGVPDLIARFDYIRFRRPNAAGAPIVAADPAK
jgi:hypothetical protein